VLKVQARSFEASWKSATFEHSRVEVGKHLHRLHRGFASHLAWVQLDMGHCGPPDQVGSLYTRIHHLQGPKIYAKLYLSHIVRYYSILKTIISDRGSIFVVRFWEQLHDCLATHLIYSSSYHP
jgi:hypothetical protein